MRHQRFLTGLWPVVQRELREGARRPVNYWLRVIGATAGVLLVVFIAHNSDENEKVLGQELFAGLHVLLMGLICLIVPCMTADCVAREKREGTLGLLFLTPLMGGGIVAGKGLVEGLRALTLWFSLVPVLTIPFVMGGVTWEQASAYLTLEFSILVLCLAAGLLTSMLVKGRGGGLCCSVDSGHELGFGLLYVSDVFISGRGSFFFRGQFSSGLRLAGRPPVWTSLGGNFRQCRPPRHHPRLAPDSLV